MKFFYILLCILIFSWGRTDEVIQDADGNYILMRDDGTFKNLPTPKKGNKYIIKKKKVENKKKKFKIFKKSEKKARSRTNSGIR